LEERTDVALEAVPCSGRIDPRYILKAFEGGASKVCLLACPEGDCKLLEGNLRAVKRILAAQELLAEAGVDPCSIRMFHSRDANSFDAVIEDITRFADEVTE
jgi:coenzyme F420-reducing hydrogenase delta subunit